MPPVLLEEQCGVYLLENMLCQFRLGTECVVCPSPFGMRMHQLLSPRAPAAFADFGLVGYLFTREKMCVNSLYVCGALAGQTFSQVKS
jgi:hypothetical protein